MILEAKTLDLKIQSVDCYQTTLFGAGCAGRDCGAAGAQWRWQTTSFYMIVGMVKPNSGKIFLDDMEITGEPMYRRAQFGIGYLPREASVFRKLA